MLITLVIDVRTSRVIWFAEAEPSSLLQDGEQWIATVQSDEVPRGMNLLNCYKFKFVGGKFISPSDLPPNRVKSVLETNKEAVIKKLYTKLQAVWNMKTPWHYASLDSAELQQHAKRFEETQMQYVKLILDARNDDDIDTCITKISRISLEDFL
jgi:hypothetical protein